MQKESSLFNCVTSYEINGSNGQREVLFFFGLPFVEILKEDNIVLAYRFFPAFLRALGYEYKAVTLPEYFRRGLLEFPKPHPRDIWFKATVKFLEDCLNESFLDCFKAFTIDELIAESIEFTNSRHAITRIATNNPHEFAKKLFDCCPSMPLYCDFGTWESMSTSYAMTLANEVSEVERFKNDTPS